MSEVKKPFWQRPFPQVYRCKSCGVYSIMKEPEPWAGHACEGETTIEKMKGLPQPINDIFQYLGEWEFIAEGDEARELIADLTNRGENNDL